MTQDGLIITPPLRKHTGLVRFETHNDHRMAMSLALFERAGLAVFLDQPGCVAKSFPGFWKTWGRICPETRITEKM